MAPSSKADLIIPPRFADALISVMKFVGYDYHKEKNPEEDQYAGEEVAYGDES